MSPISRITESGVCTLEGNGYYTYRPSSAETDGALIAFTFLGSGAVPATIQVFTITAAQAAGLTTSTGAGAITALSLIRSALILIGQLDPQETAGANEAAQSLAVLQDLIASWATERLTITTVPRATYSLAANTATFTIGTGATLSTPRPDTIAGAAYVSGTGTTAVDIPLPVLTDAEWQAIPNKALTATVPSAIWYDYGFTTAGYGTIQVWPVPTAVTTLVLYVPTAILGPLTLASTLLYPPGYAKALRYNLAAELAPVFGIPAAPKVEQLAARSLATLKRTNSRPVELSMDRALVGRPIFDIWTGV